MAEENLYTFENEEYRRTYWHTCSHVLAQAMKRLHPEVKLAIGPAIENGVYYVTGRSMDRLIDSVNFDNEESLNYFHRTLRRWGVIDALRAKGAQEGDSVVVGDMEFDFVE